MITLFNDGLTVPAAFVTVGRQRVKQFSGHGNGSVYLNHGDEFEIEFFNPTTTKVLAKIELNGVSLGSGIVLRPGERVFLERYLNEAKKFLFETYEVDGNNPGVQKAISNNGQVSVKFYNEYINYGITYTGGCSQWQYSPTIPSTAWPISQGFMTSNTGQGRSASLNYCQSSDANNFTNWDFSLCNSSVPAAPIETGRIEKGASSNQSFTYDNTSFNTWWSWSSDWKILPASQKPIVREDLKVYCAKCGTKRRKSSDNFCPKCGTKF